MATPELKAVQMRPTATVEPLLRVGDRIVNHLKGLRLETLTAEDVWPKEATQDGIALAVRKTRAHISLELRRLEAGGRVIRFLAHVKDIGPRRLVYRPGNATVVEMMEESGTTHRFAVGRVQSVRTATILCPGCGKSIRVLLDEDGAHAES